MSEDALRLDKFLWCARFFKTRTLAADMCAAGRIRVNGQVTEKAHYTVRPGDVLTVPQGGRVHVIRVLSIPARRGPAQEARACYAEEADGP
jgi:ribosome-associated heat shock protein Hsp15